MATALKKKSLRAQLVQTLLNTLDFFYSSCHFSKENHRLPDPSRQYQHDSPKNTMLIIESSHCDQQHAPQSFVPKQEVRDNPASPSKSTYQNHAAIPPTNEPSGTVSQTSTGTEEDEMLRAEVARYREQHAQLLQHYQQLNEEMKRKKIESFVDLAAQDKQAAKVLIDLAQRTEPIPLDGINIGLFGLTSTGKSTLLNALLGQKVAETGVGETTTKITPYDGAQYVLWDVPGRNDEVSYLTMEYISFFKGLTKRLILVQATMKENSSMMKLLDEIGLDYDIVFNKFDKVEEDEQEEVKKQIRTEIERIGLKKVNNVFFVSAKHPQMFPDWLTMVNSFTNASA